MTRANTFIWAALMLLTWLGFALGERATSSRLILLVAGVKFVLVARQFMDLRHAALRWSAGLAVLLALILGLAMFLA
jgi:Zn-dependent protease